MSRMKFIRFEDAGIVIFEGHVKHSDIRSRFPDDTPLSAGFFNVGDPDKADLFGESESLKLRAGPEDVKLLQRRLRGY